MHDMSGRAQPSLMKNPHFAAMSQSLDVFNAHDIINKETRSNRVLGSEIPGVFSKDSEHFNNRHSPSHIVIQTNQNNTEKSHRKGPVFNSVHLPSLKMQSSSNQYQTLQPIDSLEQIGN